MTTDRIEQAPQPAVAEETATAAAAAVAAAEVSETAVTEAAVAETATTTTTAVATSSHVSRKERKRQAAAIRAQLLGLNDAPIAADEFDPETAFPLGLPMDVIEFHVLQYCSWPCLVALQFAYPRLTRLLGGSDVAWERLFRQMGLISSAKWRNAKKKQLAVAKNPRATWRERVKYCLGCTSDDTSLVAQQPRLTGAAAAAAAFASAASAFSPIARKGLLRVSAHSGHFSGMSKEQIECLHMAATHDTTLHCFFCATCALKVPEGVHMTSFF